MINGCSPELEYGYAAGTPHGLPFLATRGQLLLSGHNYSFAGEHLSLREGNIRINKNAEERLKELGFELPPPHLHRWRSTYQPSAWETWCMFPARVRLRDGKSVYVGQVGAEVSPEEGYQAAQICALNCLAAVKSLLGLLDKVTEVVHVRGFVNSAGNFYNQPQIINGASELFVKIFGVRMDAMHGPLWALLIFQGIFLLGDRCTCAA